MKVKNGLIFLVFFCTITAISAQNTGRERRKAERDSLYQQPFRKRLTFSIGGGLAFGSVTNISVQPQVGYRITPRLTAGVGGNYQYFKFDMINPPVQIYGGNTFVRYQPHPQFFTQAEYQLLNYKYVTATGWNDYAMVGAGYMPGGGFFISAYYILKYPANNNIYNSPFMVRVGYMF